MSRARTTAPRSRRSPQHDLSELGRRLRERVLEREVRYGATGPDAFVIDAVPRMFTPEEWETLDRGLAQRVRALDAFLRDAYGERRIVEAGVVPARLIEDGAFYEPDMQGVEVPVWAGFAGLDVVRGADGQFNVLEDNVRMPTGLGFAPLAWEAVADLLDGGLPDHSPARGESDERFKAILRSVAPDGRGDPSIVVLGDGFENDAQWEISDVAFRLGVPMVTLDDLRQREGRVYAHVDGRRREVDVIYRRSNYHLLRDEDGSPSALAEKLLEPIRRGTVTVVNPPGVGIADDKLAHVYVEDMIRFYLDEEPVIAPARSYDLTDDDAREDALGRLGGDGRQGPRPRRRRGRADRRGGRGRARGHRGAPRGLRRPGDGRAVAPSRRCSTASCRRGGSTCGR